MIGQAETGTRDPVLDAVGAAFSRLRDRTAAIDVEPPVTRKDRARSIVLNLVDEARGEITVGGVAGQLTVDPSVASRMVSDCITAGLLVRTASQQDGRRSVLELTAAGRELRARIAARHRQVFEMITQEWPEAKRSAFAQLLIEYADAAAAFTDRSRQAAR